MPGYAFAPHYVQDLPGSGALRLHHLDEGDRAAPVAVCLHGQPSWSCLYRKMIPVFVAGGMRVLAHDLFGFSRSDQPAKCAGYAFDFHRTALLDFVRHHDLRGATLVCQDWGGLLGWTVPMDLPGAFNRLIVMNTGFCTRDTPLGRGFLEWRAYNASHPAMDIAAPDAPRRSRDYRRGGRSLRSAVPGCNVQGWRAALSGVGA